MSDTSTLVSALTAAAAEYTWESNWTSDGENSKQLSEWLDSMSQPSESYNFTFDGTRVIRRGADVQDYKILLYLAEERCDSCGRFLQRDAKERSVKSIVTAKLCVGCLSGGVINKSMFK